MDFEWDEEKNRNNIKKHGFDFSEANEIFRGPMLVGLDINYEYTEERWVGIGMTKGLIVVVVFTERDQGKTIRIISLRKALKHERKRFEAKIKQISD